MAPVLSYLRGHRHTSSSNPTSPLPPSASSYNPPEFTGQNHHATAAAAGSSSAGATPASPSLSWSSYSPHLTASTAVNVPTSSNTATNALAGGSMKPQILSQHLQYQAASSQNEQQTTSSSSLSPPPPVTSVFSRRSRIASSSPDFSPVSLEGSGILPGSSSNVGLLSLTDQSGNGAQDAGRQKVPSPWRMAFSRSGSAGGGSTSPSSADQSPRPPPLGQGGVGGFRNRQSPDTGNTEPHSQREPPQPTSPKFQNSRDRESHFVEPAAAPRSSKTKLNLLNPMSLLARRRSSQVLAMRSQDHPPNISRLSVPALPDDYDPRIRGHIVHDFSAPRPRRVLSSDNAGNFRPGGQAQAQISDAGQQPRMRYQQHGRSFTDVAAFQDVGGRAMGDRRIDVDNGAMREDMDGGHASAQNAAGQQSADFRSDAAGPVVNLIPASDLESSFQTIDLSGTGHDRDLPSVPEIDTASVKAESINSRQPSLFESSARPSSPPKAHNSTISRASRNSSLQEDSVGGLPKHLTSSGSRFSFDLGGLGSAAQERILEERHKQKEAARRAAKRDSVYEDSEDELDYEAMMADPGYEEAIPGINADDDDGYDDTIYGGVSSQVLADTALFKDFHFSPTLPSILGSPSVVQTSNGWLSPGPLDEFGNPIGNAMTTFSTPLGQPVESTSDVDDEQYAFKAHQQQAAAMGLGVDFAMHTPGYQQLEPTHMTTASIPKPQQHDFDLDDDLYFDDGNIDALPEEMEGEAFDESIFDDENGHLYDRKVRDLRSEEEKSGLEKSVSVLSDVDIQGGLEMATMRTLIKPQESPQLSGVLPASNGADEEQDKTESISALHDLGRPHGPSSANELFGLTETNLAAFHNALANAAQEAAKNDEEQSVYSQDEGNAFLPQHHTVSFAHPVVDDTFVPEDDFQDNTFPFDDNYSALSDDAIIAEANAEALENDDEGFYGSEFGFYARSLNGSDDEMVNGGFFGPKGVEGVHRSHSGRANFQEPSLTPITEKSEWSTRNSLASLPRDLSQATVASPTLGLAQLVEREDGLDHGMDESDMTLRALMKLRRGAFGGSNGSLRSNGGASSAAGGTSQTGSPLTQSFHAIPLVDPVPWPSESLHSARPQTQPQFHPHQQPSSLPPTSMISSPTSPSRATFAKTSPTKANFRSHSRTSSGAESVSYAREMDPDGSGNERWVLERRRTSEAGESEVVGREVLEGMSI